MNMLQSSDSRLALTVCLVSHAQDDLGRAVVARHHVRSHEEAGGGRPGQAEVEDLQRTVGFHYYVTGFQILGSKEVRGQQEFSRKLIVNFTINYKDTTSNALN